MKPKHRDMSSCQCPADLQNRHLEACAHFKPPNDPVNHPTHYTSHPSGVEVIQITEHMNFCLGNAVKYILRAGKKTANPLEDLRKSVWYLEREIERLSKSDPE